MQTICGVQNCYMMKKNAAGYYHVEHEMRFGKYGSTKQVQYKVLLKKVLKWLCSSTVHNTYVLLLISVPEGFKDQEIDFSTKLNQDKLLPILNWTFKKPDPSQ